MSLAEEQAVAGWLRDNIDGVIGVDTAERALHVHRGPFRPAEPGVVVDPSVFVLSSGGEDIRRRDWREERPAYSLLVRSAPNDYDGGKALVDELERICNALIPPGFFDCHVVSGRAHYLRQDDQNQHLWSINIALKKSA